MRIQDFLKASVQKEQKQNELRFELGFVDFLFNTGCHLDDLHIYTNTLPQAGCNRQSISSEYS